MRCISWCAAKRKPRLAAGVSQVTERTRRFDEPAPRGVTQRLQYSRILAPDYKQGAERRGKRAGSPMLGESTSGAAPAVTYGVLRITCNVTTFCLGPARTRRCVEPWDLPSRTALPSTASHRHQSRRPRAAPPLRQDPANVSQPQRGGDKFSAPPLKPDHPKPPATRRDGPGAEPINKIAAYTGSQEAKQVRSSERPSAPVGLLDPRPATGWHIQLPGTRAVSSGSCAIPIQRTALKKMCARLRRIESEGGVWGHRSAHDVKM